MRMRAHAHSGHGIGCAERRPGLAMDSITSCGYSSSIAWRELTRPRRPCSNCKIPPPSPISGERRHRLPARRARTMPTPTILEISPSALFSSSTALFLSAPLRENDRRRSSALRVSRTRASRRVSVQSSVGCADPAALTDRVGAWAPYVAPAMTADESSRKPVFTLSIAALIRTASEAIELGAVELAAGLVVGCLVARATDGADPGVGLATPLAAGVSEAPARRVGTDTVLFAVLPCKAGGSDALPACTRFKLAVDAALRTVGVLLASLSLSFLATASGLADDAPFTARDTLRPVSRRLESSVSVGLPVWAERVRLRGAGVVLSRAPLEAVRDEAAGRDMLAVRSRSKRLDVEVVDVE